MKTAATHRLLSAAAARLRMAQFASRFRRTFIALAIIALVAMLAARLLAVLPSSWFTPSRLAILPAAALLVSLLRIRRLPETTTARLLDTSTGSKDLFLTASLLHGQSSEYRSLVATQADTAAEKINLFVLLPLRWVPCARDIIAASAVLAAAFTWLPQYDPFRMQEKRGQQARQQQRLEETKKITAARKHELDQKGTTLTEQVDKALAKLEKTLKEARPDQREATAKRLNEETADFSELWKKAAGQLPKIAAENFERSAQSFGGTEQKKALKEMIEQLKKGDADALRKALENFRKDTQEIAKLPEGAEKKQKLDKLAKELAKAASQLREQLGDKALNEALQRAIEQMAMAGEMEMSKDALDAANESLQLGEEELKQLAQNFKDAANLEDALKNLAMARQLNAQGKLDGKDAEGASSQADYEALYEKLMAQSAAQQGGDGVDGVGDQQGSGKSGKNAGIGNGGTVGEDPSTKTTLKDQKDKTQLGQGRLLMQWKEEGQGEIGSKSGDYQAAIRAVKEGIAEAIRNEQIPPGYHGTIQKYFDKLPEKPDAR